MENVGVMDKVKVAEMIVKNEIMMLVFLKVGDDEKKQLVKALLDDKEHRIITMTALVKAKHSFLHVRSTLHNWLSLTDLPLPLNHIHQSTFLSHHYPPRDPNIPYEPRWKLASLFPPEEEKELELEQRSENMKTRKDNLETRNDLHLAIKELKASSGCSKERSAESEKVVEDVSKMENVGVMDKVKVDEMIVKNEFGKYQRLMSTSDEMTF
ncbi:hypothetical protein POM88_031249 [Heracleum sosnowskyi]|uniref:Uncharacterized protein n=1 Tax=Heracleum sosnowskyi TaxID=360622 RepID=A0AAD8HYG4_9APIA|nr:hypothetical protein POM88_031249 [Heracleum sosnowskyi]